jgi:hypothetical protein
MKKRPNQDDVDMMEAMHQKEFLKGKDLSNQDSVGRQPAVSLNDREDNFLFMQIDVDYYTQSYSNFPRK